ncbi:hypothetical protein ACFVUY_25380 [Kitasatospora sp. NPDC058063]|uniref:hypothetical protein n=1 Tax=unclassified Kitasatospora TaxID=2633591 RepID=UPI0036DBF332
MPVTRSGSRANDSQARSRASTNAAFPQALGLRQVALDGLDPRGQYGLRGTAHQRPYRVAAFDR